jgi:hypothetical protein
MTSLNSQQKQLIFDYCIGLTSEKENAGAEELIASNEQASHIHSAIKAALSPLDAAVSEPCPDSLAEGAVWRLKSVARSSQRDLEWLLADEQTRAPIRKVSLWHNLGRVATIAAVLLFALMVGQSSFTAMRDRARRTGCQDQLASMFRGFTNYKTDHDGQMPAVAFEPGAPWWMVGDQGQENRSTTRNTWLLVKKGYVDPAHFVCPGRKDPTYVQIEHTKMLKFNDFPTRGCITYSRRMMCSKSGTGHQVGRKVLVADLSPLFENLPRDRSKPLRLRLGKKLLTVNSVNHGRRGQNVLCCDGSVEFIRKRCISISTDDIFTLQDMSDGFEVRGYETPSCETDAFLAP